MWKQGQIHYYQCKNYSSFIAASYECHISLKFMIFPPPEHTVQQILPGIDGLKEHKTHQVAGAGYCEFVMTLG
ncbi:hypothetical protein KY289_037128 [Solanum tuberosum]|nr:hypothetical protein KY289_037128 [Solanum tuberosum]